MTAIERGQKQVLRDVQNKMSTTLILRKMTQSLSKVKQVTNFLNYLVVSRPSNVTDSSDLATEPVKVDLWLDKSLKSGPCEYWDSEDTRTLETEFSKFKKCPTKQEMREMFTNNKRLAAICTKKWVKKRKKKKMGSSQWSEWVKKSKKTSEMLVRDKT